jgi:hypothetical protein
MAYFLGVAMYGMQVSSVDGPAKLVMKRDGARCQRRISVSEKSWG